MGSFIRRLALFYIVLFVLSACGAQAPAIQATHPSLLPVSPSPSLTPSPTATPQPAPLGVEEYLESQPQHFSATAYGGKSFCAYDLLETEIDATQGKAYLYLWVRCEEFYITAGRIKSGTASSLPTALVLQQIGNGYEIVDYQPHTEGYNAEIYHAIFPESLWDEISSASESTFESRRLRFKRLEKTLQDRAKAYYLMNSGIIEWDVPTALP